MKLTVLCDNTTRIDGYYLGEPGASYYLEDGDTRILFDTGYSDVYLRNAEKMGIDLGNITALALSHGHDDHTGGLVHFPVTQRVPLYAHPEVFAPKRIEGKYIGSPLTKEELEKSFELKLTKDPVWLTDKLVFLGEIPRANAYEARYAIGERLTEAVELGGTLRLTLGKVSDLDEKLALAEQILSERRTEGVQYVALDVSNLHKSTYRVLSEADFMANG